MYTLAITIDYHYWKHDCKYYHVRQTEKKALESYFQKQDKTFFAGNIIISQSKSNTFLIALSTKSFSSNILSFAPKKQSNFLQIDLFSKLANNNKLTSDKYKKYLKNNLYLYYSTKDYKLNFYSKK